MTWLTNLSLVANYLTCGPRGYTICERLYAASTRGSRLAKIAVKATDQLFWFDKQHCRKSYLMRRRK